MVEILTLCCVATVVTGILLQGYSGYVDPDTNWWDWPQTSFVIGIAWNVAFFTATTYLGLSVFGQIAGRVAPGVGAAAAAVAGGAATNIWNLILTNPAGTNNALLMSLVTFGLGAVTNGLSWISSAVGSAMQHGTWFIFKRTQTNKVYNQLHASTLMTAAVAAYFLACYLMAEMKAFQFFNRYFAWYILWNYKTFHGYDDLVREYTKEYPLIEYFIEYLGGFFMIVSFALIVMSILSSHGDNTLETVTMNTESSAGFGGVVRATFFANARMKATNNRFSGEITLNAELEDYADPNAGVVLGRVAKTGVWWGKLSNALCTFITQFKEHSILACPLIILEPLCHKYGFHPVKWAWFPVCNLFADERECSAFLKTFMSAFDTPSFFDSSHRFLLMPPSLIILGVGGLTIAWTFAAMLYPLKVKICEGGLCNLDTTNKNSYVMKAMQIAHMVTWIHMIEYGIFLSILLFYSRFMLVIVMFLSVVAVCKNATHLERVSNNGETSLKVARDVKMRLKLTGTGPSVEVYAKAPTSGPNTNAYELRNSLRENWLAVQELKFEHKMYTFIGACCFAYHQYTMTPYAIK